MDACKVCGKEHEPNAPACRPRRVVVRTMRVGTEDIGVMVDPEPVEPVVTPSEGSPGRERSVG